MDLTTSQEEILSLVKQANEMHIKLQELSKEMNLGTQSLGVNLFGKLVIRDKNNEWIYRIESGDGIKLRVALFNILGKMVKENPLCEEEIIMDEPLFTMSRQKVLKPITKEDLKKVDPLEKSFDFIAGVDNDVAKRICALIARDMDDGDIDIVRDIFYKMTIGWFGEHNIGIDDEGKIKIFDYTGNLAFSGNNTKIISFHGGEQYAFDLR